jgi:hypothetical protein
MKSHLNECISLKVTHANMTNASNWFQLVQICLDRSKMFWTRPKKITTEFHILNHVQKVWSSPKQFGNIVTNLDAFKTIWNYRGSPTYAKIANTDPYFLGFGICTRKWGIFGLVGDLLQSH